jgi:hypothetical protein
VAARITERELAKLKAGKAPEVRPKEKEVQRAILSYLAALGVMAWRTNSGGFKGKSGSYYRFHTQRGCADIIGVLPGGRFLAIEVKRPGKDSTSKRRREEQLAFQDAINGAGGLAFIARSVAEVEAVLREVIPIWTPTGSGSGSRSAPTGS